MSLFDKLFGKPKVEPVKIVEKPKVIDFESKLYNIICAFGEDEFVGDNHEYVYRYKSIKICVSNDYHIFVNDIKIYASFGNHRDNDAYWKNDIIELKCKEKVISLIDELYDKAIKKIENDRLLKIASDRDIVRSGCKSLYKGFCKKSCINTVLPYDDVTTPYYVCGKNGKKLADCNKFVYQDPSNGIVEIPDWCPDYN
jgi:hypothetical protein